MSRTLYNKELITNNYVQHNLHYSVVDLPTLCPTSHSFDCE